jgi:glyoxylase-like metal-dependent hydrolase (beta-lactamase superfamily II)
MMINKTALIVLVVGIFLTGCSGGMINDPNKLADKSKVYVYESDASGFNTKSFFYDNGEEVVVFDAQFTPEFAKKSIEFLKTKTVNPITYVIITHPNPDKFNGISEFEKIGAKIIGSSRTVSNMRDVHEYKKYFFVNVAKMFTEENYPRLSSMDIIFDQTHDLYLKNGVIIKLRELGEPAVSTNQTIAWIPAAKAVMVGDLVHYHAHAWLEGGIVNGKPMPTLDGWVRDLNELQAMLKDQPGTIVYGGRGDAIEVGKAIEQQKIYLREADRIVTRYIASLGARKSELKGEKAAEHYQVLQNEFEKVFPHYQLGYMIQYGIYGLVNSKL